MKLKDYRMQIVGLGFATAIGATLNVIPDVPALQTNTKYLFVAIIAFSAYTWFTEYHQRALLMNKQLGVGFTKTPDFDRTAEKVINSVEAHQRATPQTPPPTEHRQPRGEPDEAGPGRAVTTTSGRVAKPRKKDLRPIFDEFENVPGEKIR